MMERNEIALFIALFLAILDDCFSLVIDWTAFWDSRDIYSVLLTNICFGRKAQSFYDSIYPRIFTPLMLSVLRL